MPSSRMSPAKVSFSFLSLMKRTAAGQRTSILCFSCAYVAGDMRELGILCQGGLYNAVIRALQQLGFADAFGASRVPIYCMNVTYPLIPEEITEFCKDKASVLVVEEGQPAYIEEAVLAMLRRHEVDDVKVHGKDLLPMAGEYTGEVVFKGI